jgi:hypothetical protein
MIWSSEKRIKNNIDSQVGIIEEEREERCGLQNQLISPISFIYQ